MLRYIIKRVLWMIPVLLGVIIIIFTLLYFTKGDPAVSFLGSDATQEELTEWRDRYGLNDGYFVRLGRYLKDLVVNGTLGVSYKTGQSVSWEIFNRFKVTGLLAVMVVIFEILFGVSMGLISATHQNSPLDRGAMIIALIGASVPGFALALVFSLIFSLKLHWLPTSGWGGLEYMVLPVMANMIAGSGGFARQTRSSMLEVIRADYVTTAKAKGLSSKKVLFKHELKSALIPIITVAGQNFGRALGGTVVMEQVFSIPGLGTYMIQGINTRNYPVVQGSVLFLAVVFSVVMLLVDIVYALIDPRIRNRFSATGARKKVKVEMKAKG
ncbi:MAG: ABC transporter permease [Oscillospiraceae bacterium]|nr:ABC transporter permease [Oscillospiraceae bacterium]